MIKIKLTNPGCGVRFKFCVNSIKFNVGQVGGPVVAHVGGVGLAGKVGKDGARGFRGIPGPTGTSVSSSGSGGSGVDTFVALRDTPRNYLDKNAPLESPPHMAVSTPPDYHGSHALPRVSGDQRQLEFTNELKAGSF